MPEYTKTPEHIAQLILKAISSHERQLGLTTLALILKGSKDKLIFERKLYNSPFFGGLLYYPTDAIENFIRQLVKTQFLQTVDMHAAPFPLPLLELTPQGKEALEKNIDIPLAVQRTIKEAAFNESIRETIILFKKEKNIPNVALKRNLAESTIWKHLITAVTFKIFKPEEIVEEEKIKVINAVKEKIKTTKLGELKAALPENITYEEIRCVLAEEKNQ